jgi:hypothetical protein
MCVVHGGMRVLARDPGKDRLSDGKKNNIFQLITGKKNENTNIHEYAIQQILFGTVNNCSRVIFFHPRASNLPKVWQEPGQEYAIRKRGEQIRILITEDLLGSLILCRFFNAVYPAQTGNTAIILSKVYKVRKDKSDYFRPAFPVNCVKPLRVERHQCGWGNRV